MTSEAFKEIYRGYLIDYNTDFIDTEPAGENVHIIKDGVIVHKVGGVESAYGWIDRKKREEANALRK